MNLRHRLQRQTFVSALVVFALLLVLLFVWTIHDTRKEIAATRSLIRQTVRDVLIAQGNTQVQPALNRGNDTTASPDTEPLRHVTLAVAEGLDTVAVESSSWIDRLVDVRAEFLPVNLGNNTATGTSQLVIRANARSEFLEHLLFAGAAFAGLAMFGAVVAWSQYRTLMQAFAPVQTFKARLEDFERGDLNARLPEPELDELAVIAQTFNRLAATVQRLIDEQRSLSQSLLLLRSEERQRLARELHDEMGQLLTALSVNVAISKQHAGAAQETVANFATIERDVQTLRQVTRDLLSALRDPSVPEVLPAQSPSALIASWRQQFSAVDFMVAADLDESLQRLRHNEHQAARRILQEALTNAFRHAKPTRIGIAARVTQQRLRLTIDNDGVAAIADSPTAPGYGITGMAERAAAVGAQVRSERTAANAWQVCIEFSSAPTASL